jgi:Ca-activated chloride channel homolog
LSRKLGLRIGLLAVVGLVTALGVSPVGVTPASADEPTGKLELVLDSSGSMKEPDASGTSKISAAKRALNSVVDEMPAEAKVGMRVYGATVPGEKSPKACRDSQQVVPVGPVDKPALKDAISKYEPFGWTPIAYSLRQAAADLGKDGERRILLVSDGEETCNPDPCAVAESIHDEGIDLRIDVVGLHVDGSAERQLKCIAEAGGGIYYSAEDADDLAASLEQTALRDFRPFTVTGTPVTGGPTDAEATQVSPGQYTDKLGGTAEENSRRTYKITPQPGASLHVGFTAYPPQQEEMIGANDAARLVLKTPDGDECASYNPVQWSAGTRAILTGSISHVPELAEEQESPCAAAKTLILQIERLQDYGQETGTFPFEFVVIEEPPLADRDGLPEPLAEGSAPSQDVGVEPSEPKGEVAGGGGFAEAGTLKPGTWTDSVQPGEVLFYRVRVPWGQAPKVSFRVQPSRQAEEVIGDFGVNATADAFGPTRSKLLGGDLTTVVASRTTTMSTALLPVRYRNREVELDLADVSSGVPVALSGDYYFVLTMATSGDGLGSVKEGAAQLPLQISVALDGEPTGEPHYRVPEESTPNNPTESGKDDDAGAGEGDEDTIQPVAKPGDAQGRDWLPVAVGGGLGLLTLVVIVLVALVVSLHRRNRRTQVPAGHQYGPPGGSYGQSPPPGGPTPPGGPGHGPPPPWQG